MVRKNRKNKKIIVIEDNNTNKVTEPSRTIDEVFNSVSLAAHQGKVTQLLYVIEAAKYGMNEVYVLPTPRENAGFMEERLMFRFFPDRNPITNYVDSVKITEVMLPQKELHTLANEVQVFYRELRETTKRIEHTEISISPHSWSIKDPNPGAYFSNHMPHFVPVYVNGEKSNWNDFRLLPSFATIQIGEGDVALRLIYARLPEAYDAISNAIGRRNEQSKAIAMITGNSG